MTCPDGRPFSRSALVLAGVVGVLLAVVVVLVSDGAASLPLALLVGSTAAWVVPLAARSALRQRAAVRAPDA